jgi:hypothetical protein
MTKDKAQRRRWTFYEAVNLGQTQPGAAQIYGNERKEKKFGLLCYRSWPWTRMQAVGNQPFESLKTNPEGFLRLQAMVDKYAPKRF